MTSDDPCTEEFLLGSRKVYCAGTKPKGHPEEHSPALEDFQFVADEAFDRLSREHPLET